MNQFYPERDTFYDALIARCGRMTFALMDDKPIVVSYTGGNIVMTQELIEDLDFDLEDIERLPDNAYRFGHYRLEHVATYPKYRVVEFKVIPLPPETISQSYWERLTRYMNIGAGVQ